MQNQTYAIVDEKRRFFTGIIDAEWSPDENQAKKFECLSQAQNIAADQNGYVMPRCATVNL
jgi:hypothetical protein